jgi:cell wall-associated NlpC family hydrolase
MRHTVRMALAGWLGLASPACQRLTARAAQRWETPSLDPIRTPDAPSTAEVVAAARDLPGPRRVLLDFAVGQLGTGGPGLDCSSWVQRCYAAAGFELPRHTRAQWSGGAPLDDSRLEAGDLVFFAFRTRPVDHVGIYAGRGAFLHVSAAAGCVQWARLDAPSFAAAQVGYRRWIETPPASESGGVP